jgi:hypothetical protein
MDEPNTRAETDPRKPYVPPAIEELGGVDDQTGLIAVGYFAEPGGEPHR